MAIPRRQQPLRFTLRRERDDQRVGIGVDAPELPSPLTFWFLVSDEGLHLVGFELGGAVTVDEIQAMNESDTIPLLVTPAVVRHVETHFHAYRRAAEAFYWNDRGAMVSARRSIIRGGDKWERMTLEDATSFLRMWEAWSSYRGGVTELAVELGVDRKTVYRRKARAEKIVAAAP